MNQEKKQKMFSFHFIYTSAHKTGPHLKPHFKPLEHRGPHGDEWDGTDSGQCWWSQLPVLLPVFHVSLPVLHAGRTSHWEGDKIPLWSQWCETVPVVPVAGHEYFSLSCHWCQNIKLMDLNKQLELLTGNDKGQSSCELKKIQNDVITAFSGEYVYRMVQCEENRLFLEIGNGKVLELDTSTTRFTQVRTINTGWGHGLCYVPDPHRVLGFSSEIWLHVVYCDKKNTVCRLKIDGVFNPGCLLYIPSHDVILVADQQKNIIAVLKGSSGEWIQSIRLPSDLRDIHYMFLFHKQIVVASEKDRGRVAFFSVKWILCEI